MSTTLERQTAGALPFAAYKGLSQEELTARIQAVREKMGPRLLILGHHYQRDEVIELSDLQGDSYRLSALAAENKDCRAIIFCGVHFMAETADILANRPERVKERRGERIPVVLPDMKAGCSMADMAAIDQVENCWNQLGQVIDLSEVIPVTYVNSAASLKAFCGRHGGTVCTSANADVALQWALSRGRRVLFFPDQHLGRNTALRMGIPLEEMPVWDPQAEELGGQTKEAIQKSRVILWKGYCSVHQIFLPSHVDYYREHYPGIRILVHPECMREVVEKADVVGSTGKIIRAVEEAPPGTKWAIGTELHLVNRLKKKHPEQEIYFLAPVVCMCSTMFRIDLPHLCWAAENLAAGTPVNVIRVDDATAADALVALERMLQLKG
ncbi:MAG: quinolinate synthase NadA [Thermogutta sp.]|nr:quinolinate synthase NadA [Thermogutta sp.]HOP77440.1 quinolinate synthase NadA [Thermogutta sp.]HPU05033.1 quinolinate synthase NadA [Thermogutta sp.]HQF14407.1 quinolinate synthase NadA [Thermogutta sp.]